MALIHWVASTFFPEKSEGSAAFSSVVCEDMGVGAGVTRGIGPVTGGFPGVGSEGVSGDKGSKGWGFL